jgi:hypothetical protein
VPSLQVISPSRMNGMRASYLGHCSRTLETTLPGSQVPWLPEACALKGRFWKVQIFY